MNPEEVAKVLKSKRNVLILAGALSERISLENGKSGADYVVILAGKLKAVVGAATSNLLQRCKKEGITGQKTWTVEMIQQLQKDSWTSPLPPEKPDLVIFIGYPADVVDGFCSALAGLETLALTTRRVCNATFSAPDLSLQGWQDYLEEVIRAVA